MSARAGANTDNLAAKAQNEFASADANKDGKLTRDEAERQKGTGDKLKALFAKYDKNRDGVMSKDELTGILKALDRKLESAEIEVAFKQADSNADGKIDVNEFIGWITRQGKGDGAAARKAVQAEFGKLPDVETDEMDWRHCMQYFEAFAGKDGGLNSAEWTKLCKQSGLHDKKFTTADSDLIYSKVVDKQQKVMIRESFQVAIRHVANKKGCKVREVQEVMSRSTGPSFDGTQAEYNKFHDDTSTYTGSKADAKDREDQRKEKLKAAAESQQKEEADEATWDDCQSIFTEFAGTDMDGREFMKLCTDSKLFDKNFKKENVDTIFATVAGKKKRIDFECFKKAIRIIATTKKVKVHHVQSAVASSQPVKNATKADAVKFHDDKSLYTGVHLQGGPSTVDAGKSLADQVNNKHGQSQVR
jgi:hypothetical protein